MRICVTTVGIEEIDVTEQLRDILPLFSHPLDSRSRIQPDALSCEVRCMLSYVVELRGQRV